MWLVFKKEIKELLRDRRSLFFLFALPIFVFPLIFGIAGYFASQAMEEAENKVLRFALVGGASAPELVNAFKAEEIFEFVDVVAEGQEAGLINQGKVDFVLTIPENFSSDVLGSGQHTLKLFLNDASVNLIHQRVSSLLADQETAMRNTALLRLNVTEQQGKALLDPVVIEKVDVSEKRENWGEKIGGLVPYLVFILCFQGAMFPATDMGAGEKERGTLETLLISPIERHQLVLGKFLAIGTAGGVTALVTICSLATWGVIIGQGMAITLIADVMSAISVFDFVLMFMVLVPVVAIFAAILLSLSIYARSFKEAQTYMGSLIVVVIVPVMMAMLPGVQLKGGWAWVPLTNVALAIKELIKGTMDYFQLLAIFSSTALIAGGLLVFCVFWFNKEKVLFR